MGFADDGVLGVLVDHPKCREGARGRHAALGLCGKNATHPGKPRCTGCRSAISLDIFGGWGDGI
jgi:hypothetical protein